MANTEIGLIIFFAAKMEKLYTEEASSELEPESQKVGGPVKVRWKGI